MKEEPKVTIQIFPSEQVAEETKKAFEYFFHERNLESELVYIIVKEMVRTYPNDNEAKIVAVNKEDGSQERIL